MGLKVKGLTDRQLAYLRTAYLVDTCKIQQEKTQGADGGVTWDDIDPDLTPCRAIERNAFAFAPQGVDQTYDTTIICGGEVPLQEGGPKYRVLWTSYKPDPISGDPVPDRERTLMVLSIDAQRDASGAHVFQNLRCKSA